MRKFATGVFSAAASLALVVCACHATALADAWDGVQEEAVEKMFESEGAGDVVAENLASEEQPAEDEGRVENPAIGAVLEPNDDAAVAPAETADGLATLCWTVGGGNVFPCLQTL